MSIPISDIRYMVVGFVTENLNFGYSFSSTSDQVFALFQFSKITSDGKVIVEVVKLNASFFLASYYRGKTIDLSNLFSRMLHYFCTPAYTQFRNVIQASVCFISFYFLLGIYDYVMEKYIDSSNLICIKCVVDKQW